MNPNFYFTATRLPILKKKGVAVPDADGYYEIIIGGLNVHNNSRSYFYTAEAAKQLFAPGTILQRRIANGCLRAEVNHPTQKPGEKNEAFVARYLDTDLNNTCGHFKAVWLDENFGKEHPEYNEPGLIAIMGLVKPIPPKGDILKEALENPVSNACFSIRGVADEGYQRGKRVRVLKEIIDFDFVNEGGVLVASKWDSPATESIDNTELILPVTKNLLERVAESSKEKATESSTQIVSELSQRLYTPQRPSIWARW